MPWKPYVANALIAAALGAGTNELAIIAILRFILPGKKKEIAARIRDVVATDLLSPDKMRQKLDDPQIGQLLYRYADAVLAEFLERDLPAPGELLSANQDELAALAQQLRASLLNEYSRRVSDGAFADTVIRPFLEERGRALRDRTPRSLLRGGAEALPGEIASWLESLEGSEYLRNKLRRGLDEWLSGHIAEAHSPAELLSPAIASAAEELAVSQAPVVVEELTDLLRRPEVRAAISGAVMNAIRRQLRGQGVLGGIKGMFVSVIKIEADVRGVVGRLPDALYEDFHRPQNRAAFARVLRDAVRKAFARDMDAAFKSDAMRAKVVDLLMERVWRRETFAGLGAQAARMAERGLDNTLGQLLEKAGVSGAGDAVLDMAAERCRRMLASPATREFFAKQFDEFVAVWRTRPLGRLKRFVSEDARKAFAGVVAEEIRLMLRSRLAEFADESGVWDIITSSIENYDDKELSALIQQLARSELRMVTALGGVIGLMVGLMQTYMHSRGWF